MKKVVLVIVLVFGISRIGDECPLNTNFIYKRSAQFRPAYEKIRSWEGNWSHHSKDKGWETYGGITKRYNPKWKGWNYIIGKKVWNQRFEKAEHYVFDYYLTIWVREGFYKIEDQRLANYLFDLRVNTSQSFTRDLLSDILKTDFKNEEWITEEINEYNPLITVELLKDARIEFYKNLVREDISQRVFLEGWLRRAENV